MYKFTIIVNKQRTLGTKAQQNLDFLKPIQNYQMLGIRNTVKIFWTPNIIQTFLKCNIGDVLFRSAKGTIIRFQFSNLAFEFFYIFFLWVLSSKLLDLIQFNFFNTVLTCGMAGSDFGCKL